MRGKASPRRPAWGYDALPMAGPVVVVLADPTGYGRVVRNGDGSIERVVETKGAGDATAGELDIAEVNTGVYAFTGGPLLDALHQVRPDNAQNEVYLPDAFPVLKAAG